MTKRGIWINQHEFVAFGDRASLPRSLAREIATRRRSIDFVGAFSMYLPDPDATLRKLGKDIAVYRELLTDAHVGATVDSRKSRTRSLAWRIVPGADGPSARLEADMVGEMFARLDMDRLVGEILNAPLFGFQPMEVMWASDGSFIVAEDVVGKPPEWFVFTTEGRLAFRTKERWTGEPVPPRKFLLPRHNPSYANPYGERILSRCFWPVTFKRGGLKFWVIFTEKYSMPFLIGKHPRGTREEEVEALLTSLENMLQDAVAVIPDDSSVLIEDASSRASSAEVYERLLDFTNAEISKAILGQTLTTEVGRPGSYAASKTHMEVRREILEADRRLVEQTMNTLIGWVHELNFPRSTRPPRFVMHDAAGIRKELAERDRILSQVGVRFTKRYLMETYGFDEDHIVVAGEDGSAGGVEVEPRGLRVAAAGADRLNGSAPEGGKREGHPGGGAIYGGAAARGGGR